MSVLCEGCDNPIPEARIKAAPNAKLCVDCQSGREDSGEFRKHKIEVSQEIKGWTHESVTTTIIKGDEV